MAEEAQRMLFAIYPDNESAVVAFLTLQTQWRIIAGMQRAIYQGIEYAAILPVLNLLGIPPEEQGATFEAIRVMESAALGILNAPRDTDDG